MPRIQSITQALFDNVPLGFPLALRVGRSAPPKPASGDDGPFATSVQLGQSVITVELRTRDVAAAESLALGRQGELVFATGPTQADQPPRQVRVSGAVLYAVELAYDQDGPATAVLRFMAESGLPMLDPFQAQEVTL